MDIDIMPHKTHVNDIVLVYREDIPQFFARVEDISEDIKPGWFHLKLLVLTIPVQMVTWILKDIYIDGTEFSMEGQKMKLEKVVIPSGDEKQSPSYSTEDTEEQGAEVISFSSFKK